jgi:hypothetical protein
MKHFIALAIAAGLVVHHVPAYALENASVVFVKYGTVSSNGSGCLYVGITIPSEAVVPTVNYTMAFGSKSGDLAAAMFVAGRAPDVARLSKSTINFDSGNPNPQCQEFDGFAGVPSILRPGAP